MGRRLRVITLAVVMVLGLSGCSLLGYLPQLPPSSGPAALPSDLQDKLIGVFATTAVLDLAEGERVFATTTPQDSASPAGQTPPRLTFPGLDGFALLAFSEPTTPTTSTQADDSVLDVAVAFADNSDATTGETISTMTLTGTLHVGGPHANYMLVGNPVYETSAGKVYLVQGDQSVEVNPNNVGMSLSVTLAQNISISTASQTKGYDATVTFTVTVVKAPQQIVILDMSSDNNPLSRTEYAPGTVPDSLTPAEGTAYIIVETDAADSSVSREILGLDATNFLTYAAREDGTCIGHNTTINWS